MCTFRVEIECDCISFRLEQIGAAAAKEYSLEKNLQKMKVEWKDMIFEFVPYRDSVSYCLGFTQGLFAINDCLSIDSKYITHRDILC